MKRHVMLDLETLGLKPGCPIISIGAVCFLNAPDHRDTLLYAPISLVSQAGTMDKPDPDTLAWWAKQSDEAQQEVFNNPNAVSLLLAVSRFKRFLEKLLITPEDEIVIWGKGANFDEPVLKEAFERLGIPVPWKYNNSLCHRTLQTIGRALGVPEPEFVGVKHNAFQDAMHQVRYAERVLEHLNITDKL